MFRTCHRELDLAAVRWNLVRLHWRKALVYPTS
jgi:hypothetical protein